MSIDSQFLASVGVSLAGVPGAVSALQRANGQPRSAIERLGIAAATPAQAASERAASREVEVAPAPLIHVTIGPSARSNRITTQREMRWTEFVRVLQSWPLHVGPLSLAEYQRCKNGTVAEKARAAAAKDTEWYSWARFSRPLRATANVVEIFGFIGDFDGGTLTREQISAPLSDLAHLVMSTCSHHPDSPRWRLHVPYSRPVTPAEHARLFDHFVALYPAGAVDTATRDPGRLWFAPGCWSDTAEYREFHVMPREADAR